ncbi:general transcription factor IIF subunit 2 isoform X2 [Erinaceus europaeus]|uniref:General transcription factor IIF subunit 2 n=1 Tax=Erinaceus europaeus TaxID=9365 RepID=A0ABM3XPQ3_ERIEU|nr:general transcription factor IIF subunit 2 isoform X2 [Erinaceus europaeus]
MVIYAGAVSRHASRRRVPLPGFPTSRKVDLGSAGSVFRPCLSCALVCRPPNLLLLRPAHVPGDSPMAERGELDLTGAKQNTGVWLVKVPKYLSQQWAKAPGKGEVGKLRIAKNQGRTEVSFTLNEDLANIHDIGGKPASVSAPREHPFVLQSVGGQTLTVFTESSSGVCKILPPSTLCIGAPRPFTPFSSPSYFRVLCFGVIHE